MVRRTLLLYHDWTPTAAHMRTSETLAPVHRLPIDILGNCSTSPDLGKARSPVFGLYDTWGIGAHPTGAERSPARILCEQQSLLQSLGSRPATILWLPLVTLGHPSQWLDNLGGML
jgi:hypothetical protein